MGFRVRKRPEEDYQSTIIADAKLHGWTAYHTRDSRGSAPDFPDLMLARRGRLIGAEVKADTYTTTDGQYAWLAELERAGVESVVWRPDDAPNRERWHVVETWDRIHIRLSMDTRPHVSERRVRKGAGTLLGIRRLMMAPGALPTCGACGRAKVPYWTATALALKLVAGQPVCIPGVGGDGGVGCPNYYSPPAPPGAPHLINPAGCVP